MLEMYTVALQSVVLIVLMFYSRFVDNNNNETAFLFQCLSVCMQRFNLIAFKGIFPTNPEGEA